MHSEGELWHLPHALSVASCPRANKLVWLTHAVLWCVWGAQQSHSCGMWHGGLLQLPFVRCWTSNKPTTVVQFQLLQISSRSTVYWVPRSVLLQLNASGIAEMSLQNSLYVVWWWGFLIPMGHDHNGRNPFLWMFKHFPSSIWNMNHMNHHFKEL